jgi:hypothetical protein
MEHHEIEKRTLCSVVGQTLIFPSSFSQAYIRETPNGRPGSRQTQITYKKSSEDRMVGEITK